MTGSITRSIGSPRDLRSSTRARSRARSPPSAKRMPRARAGRTARPPSAPGGRLPRLAEVDPLADDLLVAELHDADGHHGSVVVADRVLVDPEVMAAADPVQLELLAGRIGRPEGDDVRLAAHALAALWPLQDRVVGVDLRGAGDLVSRSAAGGGDVRGLEVRADHGPCGHFVHRKAPSWTRRGPGCGRSGRGAVEAERPLSERIAGVLSATASARCPSFPTTVRSWPPASTRLPTPRAMLPVPISVKCTVRLDSQFEFVRGGGGSA